MWQIFAKRSKLGLHFFHFSWINLCASHSNDSVAYVSPWGVALHGLFGVNNVRSFGMPCRIMTWVSRNKFSHTWKRPGTLPTKMSLWFQLNCDYCNLVATSKVRPRVGIIFWLPLGFVLNLPRWLSFGSFLATESQIVPTKERKEKEKNAFMSILDVLSQCLSLRREFMLFGSLHPRLLSSENNENITWFARLKWAIKYIEAWPHH